MAAVKEEDNLNVDILPNELSQSVDDPHQSEALNLTIRLQNDAGRKCYVDPHEAFPQATYYLDPTLKRPNYYLKKELKFNKKVLLPIHEQYAMSSEQQSQPIPSTKRKKKKSKQAQNQNPSANLKMEVDSESDDDDEFDTSNDHDDENVFDADDELFSASEVNVNKDSKGGVVGGRGSEDKMDRNFLNVFPKRKQDDDQKSESYELDNDKIKKMKKGDKQSSTDEDVFIDKTSKQKKQKKFGAWDGVFVSCLLNIFGVIMFLRLGFVVGQAGLWYTFLIILLACVVTTLTTLSMAAIATNGEQRAG